MMEITKEEYRTGVREERGRTRERDKPEQEHIEVETGEIVPSNHRILRAEEVTEERVWQAIREAQDMPRIPVQLIEKYARLAAQRGQVERLEDGSWYAEIRGFPGVWAQGNSEEDVLRELKAVVRDWTLLKIEDRDRDLPEIDTLNLNVL